jgi:hypothetical protein
MLNDLKLMLGIEADDTGADNRLNLILKNTRQQLKAKLEGIDPPETLDYIVLEVSIKRFNRLGSEGLASHTVEGEALSFVEDDFNSFTDDIQAFLNSKKESTKGKVRFL